MYRSASVDLVFKNEEWVQSVGDLVSDHVKVCINPVHSFLKTFLVYQRRSSLYVLYLYIIIFCGFLFRSVSAKNTIIMDGWFPLSKTGAASASCL